MDTWGVDRSPSLCIAFSSTQVLALASLFFSNAKFKQFYSRKKKKVKSMQRSKLEYMGDDEIREGRDSAAHTGTSTQTDKHTYVP